MCFNLPELSDELADCMMLSIGDKYILVIFYITFLCTKHLASQIHLYCGICSIRKNESYLYGNNKDFKKCN